MVQPPPLDGIRVLEFGGLAPGPFAGMLLADYGASVLRIDRAVPGAHTPDAPPPTPDQLVRRKTSIAVDIKTRAGVALIKALLPRVDVLIDPFRPGVLEKAGLDPESVLRAINPRLVVARLTGFRRDGKYAAMAGHDINYLAVSGVLSMLGRVGATPHPPGNLLGDFAGGGAACFVGILLALLARQATGRGQIVEANMVDGSAYLATMPRMSTKRWTWGGERGTNLLDGGSPFYDTYETADGKYMAVYAQLARKSNVLTIYRGALEPQFFRALLVGLSLNVSDLPGPREDQSTWPALRELFTKTFKSKTRKEWEAIFDGTDACCTPILTHQELEESKAKHRPFVTLRSSPGFAISTNEGDVDEAVQGQGPGVEGDGWESGGLSPGVGGEDTLKEWLGWKRGQQFDVVDGGLVLRDSAKL